MKTATLFVAMLALVATGQHSWDNWPAVVTGSTNVDGSVLRLEFADKEVIAGDRVFGRLVVSNASSEFRQLVYSAPTATRDAFIGDLLVTVDQGNRIPKTIWGPPNPDASGRSALLWPSNSARFQVDLVGRYSLTNPGTYFVKAVAQVPTPEGEPEDVVVETPPVAITVLPRPEDAPPPEPLHTAAQLARVPKNEEPPMMHVTPPRSRAKPPGPNLRPQPRTVPPVNAQDPAPDGRATPPDSGDPSAVQPSATHSRTRSVVYASLVLIAMIVLAGILWHARRKENAP